MKRKNVRSLGEIADSIHRLERANIKDIGDALLEAKSQCEHGAWLQWFNDAGFAWSLVTAERYMRVAKLCAKFVSVTNLKLAATTLYELVDHEPEEDLPEIIGELTKHAAKALMPPHDARRVIKIGAGRRRFGDYPEATLVQLVNLDPGVGKPWHDKAVAALKKQAPDTDEAARAIVGRIDCERRAAEHKAAMDALKRDLKAKHEAVEEAETILDGAPPELPPPSETLEPQKLEAGTCWAEADEFIKAIDQLRQLRTKPMARIAGKVASPVLRDVIDFLDAVIKSQDGALREPDEMEEARRAT